MKLNSLISEIIQKFEQPLPGIEAHLELAPYRNAYNNLEIQNPILASTLLLLYPSSQSVKFCLTQRQKYDGPHSNQISFPGGKKELNETLESTALRECNEEIGISSVNILGKLTNVYVPPSNMLIHPFVGFISEKPQFKINKREVKKLIEVNVNELYKKNIIKVRSIRLKKNSRPTEIPFLDINNEIIWGATSVILNEFRKMLKL